MFVILLENSVDVRESVEDFACYLSVREYAFVSVVLQGAGREEEPLAYIAIVQEVGVGYLLAKERSHRLGKFSDLSFEFFPRGCFNRCKSHIVCWFLVICSYLLWAKVYGRILPLQREGSGRARKSRKILCSVRCLLSHRIRFDCTLINILRQRYPP